MDDQSLSEGSSTKKSEHTESRSKHESSRKSKRRKTDKSHKYAFLPPQLINVIAESSGISNLPENVVSGLAEDATCKLREIISNCATAMKNQRRKKLLTSDVKRVFEIADVGRIHGHYGSDECGFTFIEEAGVYIQDDHEVDIVKLAKSKSSFTQKKTQAVSGMRVTLDPVELRKEKSSSGSKAGSSGKSAGSSGTSAGSSGTSAGSSGTSAGSSGTSAGSSGTSAGSSGTSAGSSGTSAGSSGTSAGSSGTSAGSSGTSAGSSGTSAGGSGTSAGSSGTSSGSSGQSTSTDPTKLQPTNKYSQELLNYYIQVARAILGGSTSILNVALTDLRTNPRAGPVCPYFFNLIELSISKLPRHEWLTSSLLSAIQAILDNPHVDPSSFFTAKITINSLLVIAIEPKVAKNCDDLMLRSRAAQLLARVLVAWNIEMRVQLDIVRKMMQLLLDKKISLQTQYGALYSLITLGHSTLNSHFWPVIGRYILILEEKQNTTPLVELVAGCIMMAAAKMYKEEWPQEANEEEWKRRYKVDYILHDYFGDAIVPVRQDFSRQGPLYEKISSGWEETEEDLSPYKPSHPTKSQIVHPIFRNVTMMQSSVAATLFPKKPIIFNFEHSRQIETKNVSKLCSIRMPNYVKSPKSFHSIWYRQNLYKKTRSVKFCLKSHTISPAGDIALTI